jgi:hypothetical protein
MVLVMMFQVMLDMLAGAGIEILLVLVESWMASLPISMAIR